METNLFLISGGGFSTEENSYIDNLALKMNKNKKICFIPTASHDANGYIEKFHLSFSEYETFHLTKEDLENSQLIEKADLIYIGGGDTHYLMKIWQETGFDKKIIELYKSGVTIVGISAGACCWFETVFENGLLFDGLGILEGSFCPHYDIDNEYKQSYDQWAKDRDDIIHYRLNDNETLHIQNDKIVAKVITYKEGML